MIYNYPYTSICSLIWPSNQLDLVINKILLPSQEFPEVPQSILCNTKVQAYLCEFETGGAALKSGGGIEVRWEKKLDLESSKIENRIRTILLFWEVGLSFTDEWNTRHVEELNLSPLHNVMGQGIEFCLPVRNF